MQRVSVIGLILMLGCIASLVGFSKYQTGSIDRKQLRTVLEQLGYTVKDIVTDPGKEKYSATFTQDGLDIPIGYEISPSNSYIWLTVNLGAAPEAIDARCHALLKQNAKVQPTFFYITDSGRLMAALAVENHEITNAVIRAKSETLAKNVGSTKAVWQKA